MLQEIVVNVDESAPQSAVFQLLGRLSKPLSHAAPLCEQEASMSDRQVSGRKRQRLDESIESSGAVKDTISMPSSGSSGHSTNNTVREKSSTVCFTARGARIVMPVAFRSKVHSTPSTNTC